MNKCGAKSKRTGNPCQRPPCAPNGRCYFHGGRSTGPKTSDGKRRCGNSNRKHDRRSSLAKQKKEIIKNTVDIFKKYLSNLLL